MRFKEISLKDAVEFIVDNRGKTVPIQDSGIPLIATNCISNKQLYPTYENIRYVSDEIFNNWFRAHPKPSDIILTNKGSKNGAICMVPDPVDFCIAQDMVALRAKTDAIYPKYLFAALRSPLVQSRIKELNVDSVIPHFKKTDFDKLYFPLPSYDIQIAIGDSYFNLCNKIHTNLLINQTLEEIAQATFKSWFVDFDPVKAKMNGEQPVGMDEATAALFPDKLVENELGLIPEGWEVGTLNTHTSIIIDHRGKTPKKLGSDWVDEGYPAISAKNIKSKKVVRPDTIRFIDEVTYKKWMKEPLVKGDIIMTSEAPMGELYFFDGSQNFCLSQRLYGLRANPEISSPAFLFNWLQTAKAITDMEGRATGTTALGIKQAELRKVKILTPPKELLDKYSVVASNLVDMAASNNAQNSILEELRDTLLPKLLSGEIELGQTEEMAEVS